MSENIDKNRQSESEVVDNNPDYKRIKKWILLQKLILGFELLLKDVYDDSSDRNDE